MSGISLGRNQAWCLVRPLSPLLENTIMDISQDIPLRKTNKLFYTFRAKKIKAIPNPADFCAHWTPVLQVDSVLDATSLSKEDREFMENNNVSAMMAWGQAMLNWTAVEPTDFRCPVLWLVGSEDQVAMITVGQYEPVLNDSRVQLHIIHGLDHGQVFDEIDRVFATMLAFTQS